MNRTKIPVLDKNQCKEIRKDVFLYGDDSDITLDTKICRYMNFEHLVTILKGRLYVPMKKKFSDLHESGHHYNEFIYRLKPVGDSSEKYEKIFDDEKEKRVGSQYWLTLCFTTDVREDYFFWRTYTNGKCGVRITTTIKQFLDSLSFDGYELFIGKMKYVDCECPSHNVNQYAFWKTDAYKNESELRIYFQPKQQDLIEEHSEMAAAKDHVTFRIDAENMVTKIILTPFFPKELRGCVSEMINTKLSNYEEITSWSRIMEI